MLFSIYNVVAVVVVMFQKDIWHEPASLSFVAVFLNEK